MTNSLIQKNGWLLFPLCWTRLLVTVPIILNQAVGYYSHKFESDGLVTAPIILDQDVGYCSHYNSNQQPDPK
jgi:hypothetical protein